MGNWLTTILAVILLLVVLDGVRRAILKHRAAMKVSRNLSRSMRSHMKERSHVRERGEGPVSGASPLPDVDPEDLEKRRQIASELPGTVRVVQRRDAEDALQINRQVKEKGQQHLLAPRRVREPMLEDAPADPVEPTEEIGGSMDNDYDNNHSDNYRDHSRHNYGADRDHNAHVAAPEPKPRDIPQQASLNLEEQVPTLMDSVLGDERREPNLDESASLEALSAAPPVQPPQPKPASRPMFSPRAAEPKKAEKPQEKPVEKPRRQPVEEVLVLNVMAAPGDYFEGNDLLRILLAAGLRFGEMNIFHYHAGDAGEGPMLFSLANMVKPGTFDLTQMEDFISPGISLFLALPVEGEAIKVFEILLRTARHIAEQLGGELKDENRSVFTAQTAEHYRQRVMEFQRRKALAKAQV